MSPARKADLLGTCAFLVGLGFQLHAGAWFYVANRVWKRWAS